MEAEDDDDEEEQELPDPPSYAMESGYKQARILFQINMNRENTVNVLFARA
jgi:hypothetical protein